MKKLRKLILSSVTGIIFAAVGTSFAGAEMGDCLAVGDENLVQIEDETPVQIEDENLAQIEDETPVQIEDENLVQNEDETPAQMDGFSDEREAVEQDYDYYTSGDFEYYIRDDGTVTIIDYTGSETDLTIPSVIDGKKVAIIGSYSFSDCTSLVTVTIPDSVTSISAGAFKGCANITSITLPNSITVIEGSTFEGCSSLTSITIPGSVTSIKGHAFWFCTNLKSVIIPDSVTSIGYGAFSGCTSLTGVTIPSNVTTIDNEVFLNCSSLTSITIPDGVASIGYHMFNGCSSLTNVTIPDSVTSIGLCAFYGCEKLTSITIPDGVASIGYNAFVDCKSLTSITIPDGVSSIENCTFENCTSLKSITIPASITSIGEGVLENCTSLTSIAMPASSVCVDWFKSQSFSNRIDLTLTSGSFIGSEAFKDCESLKSVTIPDSVKTIYYRAFSGCTNLTSVTIPGSAIGMSAFSGCTSLTSVTIPDGVTYIGYGIFSGCTSLKNVTIPDSVTTIEYAPFANCTSLKNISIPDSVTSIKYGAFIDSAGLTSIDVDENNAKYKSKDGVLFSKDMSELVAFPAGKKGSYIIPNGVTSIEEQAFYKCSNLTNITIPNSVTAIKWRAFYDCTSLTSITIPDSVAYIGRNAFESCTSLKSVTIQNGVTGIGYYAFSDCDNLTSITIPDSVTSIEGSAFIDCNNLTIYGYAGSYAQEYAEENDIPFKELKASFNSKVTATSANRAVTLSWDKVPNAANYIVKSADGSTQYTKNAITATSYTVTGLKNGTQYKFKVYAKIGGKWYDSSVVTKTPVAKPENVKAVANNKKVTLSWDKVPNATNYIVKSADGKIQYTKSAIKTTSYTVTGLTNSTQYKFKVYAKSDGKWFASSTISKTPTAKPQNLKAVAGSKKITLSWDKVDGATGYIVKSSDGKIQYTKNAIKTNSYTVTGLTGSKQYKFKVYAKVDGKWYASNTITRTAKK